MHDDDYTKKELIILDCELKQVVEREKFYA